MMKYEQHDDEDEDENDEKDYQQEDEQYDDDEKHKARVYEVARMRSMRQGQMR